MVDGGVYAWQALELLKEMEGLGIAANGETFPPLVHRLYDEGKFQEVRAAKTQIVMSFCLLFDGKIVGRVWAREDGWSKGKTGNECVCLFIFLSFSFSVN